MKKILIYFGITLNLSLYAQQIVILDKNDLCYINKKADSCESKGEDKVTMISNYKNFIYNNPSYEVALDLETPPLTWGKMVNEKSSGKILYHDFFVNGFIFKLKIDSLLPFHNYILTINGNPERLGNTLLPDTVPLNNKEKYYDFLLIKTNKRGNFSADCAIFLKPGIYDVRFYVKDTADFKIVLYHDFFKFTVK